MGLRQGEVPRVVGELDVLVVCSNVGDSGKSTWLQPAERGGAKCPTFNPAHHGLIALTIEFGWG